MHRWHWLIVMLGFGCVAGTASAATGRAALAPTQPDSTVSGTVVVTDTDAGLHIVAEILNAPPGQHGFHIHEFGACDQAGAAAGSHYNPAGVSHGDVLRDGLAHAHAGDFGNMEVSAEGRATLDLVVPQLTVSGSAHPVAGRAVILHAQPDDFGQPTGNAGGRIACGPILITGP